MVRSLGTSSFHMDYEVRAADEVLAPGRRRWCSSTRRCGRCRSRPTGARRSSSSKNSADGGTLGAEAVLAAECRQHGAVARSMLGRHMLGFRTRFRTALLLGSLTIAGPANAQADADEFTLRLQSAHKKMRKGELASAQNAFEELLDDLAALAAGARPCCSRRRPIGAWAPTVKPPAGSRRWSARTPATCRPGTNWARCSPPTASAPRPARCGNRTPTSSRATRCRWRSAAGRCTGSVGGRRSRRASRALVDSLAKASGPAEARTTLGLVKFAAYGEAMGFPSGEKDLKQVLEEHVDDEEALLAMYRVRSANMALDGGKTERSSTGPSIATTVAYRRWCSAPRTCSTTAATATPRACSTRCWRSTRTTASRCAIAPPQPGCCTTATATRRSAPGRWPGSGLARVRPPARRAPGGALPLRRRAAVLRRGAAAGPRRHPDAADGMAKALVYTGEGKQAKELLDKAKQLAAGSSTRGATTRSAVQKLLDDRVHDVVEHERFTDADAPRRRRGAAAPTCCRSSWRPPRCSAPSTGGGPTGRPASRCSTPGTTSRCARSASAASPRSARASGG
jgi:hypothetical protein